MSGFNWQTEYGGRMSFGVNSSYATTTYPKSLILNQNANVQVGGGALATNATDGFLYVPTCAGAPTGAPTAFSGYSPVVVDTTDHKLYFNDGSWEAILPASAFAAVATSGLYSSLSGLPTLGSLAALSAVNNSNWSGTALAVGNGGTGQTTAAAAFNALSPMTAAGDLVYGGASGAGSRLGIGTANQLLSVNGGATAPQWSSASSLNLVQSNASANLSAGYSVVPYNYGTISGSSLTPSLSNGQAGYYTNNGAHTLNPPSVVSGYMAWFYLTITNGSSAGSITLGGGFDTNTSNVSSYVTTNAKVFNAFIFCDNTSGTQYSTITITGPR